MEITTATASAPLVVPDEPAIEQRETRHPRLRIAAVTTDAGARCLLSEDLRQALPSAELVSAASSAALAAAAAAAAAAASATAGAAGTICSASSAETSRTSATFDAPPWATASIVL